MRARGLLVLLAVAAACDAGSSSRTAGTGGATSAGGTTGTGGVTGSGGATASGGTTGTGGSSASGGTTGAGSTATTGGTTAVGGTTAPGGVTSTGGTIGTGGTTVPRSDAGPGSGGRLDGAAGGTGGGGSGGTGTGGAGGTGGMGTGGTVGSGGTPADAAPDGRPDVPADTAREAGPEASGNDAVTSDGAPCPYNGHVTYTLAKNANPTTAEQQAYTLITEAMDKAVYYYNCYTNITKALNVSYNSGVQTADGNINGSIRFGGTQYMEYVTAMHEIAHTVGIGTNSNWSSFLKTPDGGGTLVWTGAIAQAELLAIPNHSQNVINGDSQHFWPYGLNYASEWKSEADGLAHCRLVMALRKDMGMQ